LLVPFVSHPRINTSEYIDTLVGKAHGVNRKITAGFGR
jgi:hypothetical protein